MFYYTQKDPQRGLELRIVTFSYAIAVYVTIDRVEVEKKAKEVFGKGCNGEVLLARLSVGKR